MLLTYSRDVGVFGGTHQVECWVRLVAFFYAFFKNSFVNSCKPIFWFTSVIVI